MAKRTAEAGGGDRLLVATRKGLFDVRRRGNSWRVGEPRPKGLTRACARRDPRNGALWAAIDHGHGGVKLARSAGDGGKFEEVSPPKYPETTKATAKDYRVVEPGHVSEPSVLWIGTEPGGLFRTTDDGRRWRLVESFWEIRTKERWSGGGRREPGIHLIQVHLRDARTAWPVPMESDDPRMAIGGALVVMRTTDGGRRWTELREGLPQRDAWDFPLRHALDVAPDGETLAFGTTSGNRFASRDGGATWRALAGGLPPVCAVRFA